MEIPAGAERIRVAYTGRGAFDYVSSKELGMLIMAGAISHFYRPSEKTWVNVRTDPVRGRGGFYQGPERRGKSGEAVWIERLFRDIEN